MVHDLYILMITAGVVSIVFKLLKQPVVLGYIVAGVLVGPYLYGETLVNADNVKSWGDIGVLFVQQAYAPRSIVASRKWQLQRPLPNPTARRLQTRHAMPSATPTLQSAW